MLFFALGFLTLFLKIRFCISILEGNDVTDVTRYPYMAFLVIQSTSLSDQTHIEKDWYTCCGVIVTSDVILTAGHCLSDSLTQPFVSVRAGMTKLKDKNYQSAEMIDYKIHENFIGPAIDDNINPYLSNDIAIIWLNRKFIQTPALQPATLNDGTTKVISGKFGMAIGWGLIGYDQTTNILQEGKMKVISNKYCEIRILSKIMNEALCVYDTNNRKTTPCTGDSGGPFVVNGIVVGIVSWGPSKKLLNQAGESEDFCDPTQPSIFIRIDKYLQWINENIRKSRYIQRTDTAEVFPNEGPPSKRHKFSPRAQVFLVR